jgi:hypothetical protein
MKFQSTAIRSLACYCFLQQQAMSFAPSFATTRSSTSLRSFSTWTFDEPCKTMAWNELVSASLSTDADASVSKIEGVDLVFLAIQAPTKEDDDEDDDEEADTEDSMSLSGVAKELDDSLGGALADMIQDNNKEFKSGATLGGTTPTLRMQSSQRFIALGLGAAPKPDKKDPYAGAGTTLGATVAKKCNAEKRVESCAVVVPPELAKDAAFLKDFSTSFYQTLYSDNRFRTGKKVKKVVEGLKTVTILSEGAVAGDAASLVEAGKKMATGLFLTKVSVAMLRAKLILTKSTGHCQCSAQHLELTRFG